MEFGSPEEASAAVKHMDGGQLDGSLLSVQVNPLAMDIVGTLADAFGTDFRTPSTGSSTTFTYPTTHLAITIPTTTCSTSSFAVLLPLTTSQGRFVPTKVSIAIST